MNKKNELIRESIAKMVSKALMELSEEAKIHSNEKTIKESITKMTREIILAEGKTFKDGREEYKIKYKGKPYKEGNKWAQDTCDDDECVNGTLYASKKGDFKNPYPNSSFNVKTQRVAEATESITDIHIFSKKDSKGMGIDFKKDGKKYGPYNLSKDDVNSLSDKTDRKKLAQKYLTEDVNEGVPEFYIFDGGEEYLDRFTLIVENPDNGSAEMFGFSTNADGFAQFAGDCNFDFRDESQCSHLGTPVDYNSLTSGAKAYVDSVLNNYGSTLSEGKTDKDKKYNDYLKANRRGSRDAEKELTGDGFKGGSKIHKSDKEYKRQNKYKNWDKLDEALEGVEGTMSADDIYNAISRLAKNQGFYSNLLNILDNGDPKEVTAWLEAQGEKGFKDVVDLILDLEQ